MSKMNLNLISIVIPFYKGSQFIDNIIKSLENQLTVEFEAIVVDDGRGCGIGLLIERLCQSKIFDRCRFASTVGFNGAAAARNLGISIASGRYLAFLDIDDYWQPNFLNFMLTTLQKKDARLLVSSVTYFNPDGQEIKLIFKSDVLVLSQLLQSCPVHLPAVLIDTAESNPGSFPLIHHEDFAFFLQFLAMIGYAHCINTEFVQINRRSNSLSGNKLKALRWHWSVLKNVTTLSLTSRTLLFCIYSLNAVLKRKLKFYTPIFLPLRFHNNVVKSP